MSPSLTLRELLQFIAQERNLDLRNYKVATMERRVRRRMDQAKVRSYEEYRERIQEDPREAGELLKTVLVNVTSFFRDSGAWSVLHDEILPPRIQRLKPGAPYRVWCAGCSTGEEAYSAAILVAELFGQRLPEFDVKIYATDNDEEALAVARRGEYPAEALRGIRSEWQRRYFSVEGKTRRIERNLRKLVIFGRSNLETDAAIPHVSLLVCRNVLIYFDLPMQKSILRRLHYALEPGGVLLLGKAETQVRNGSPLFRPLDTRWRIFERQAAEVDPPAPAPGQEHSSDSSRQELELLRARQNTLLSTLEPGVLVLDSNEVIITENEAARRLWDLKESLVGNTAGGSAIAQRCPELKGELEASRAGRYGTRRFACATPQGTTLNITLRPILSESGAGRVGTLVYMEDVTLRQTLQATIEELQSTSEEAETTNEELQSANEELETTNEELQSAYEELETTNEELRSLNEELETTNEELAMRARAIDELNQRYGEVLERMPWPVILVNRDGSITLWSTAAQKLFGFATPAAQGLRLEQLPVPVRVRQRLMRRHAEVAATNRRALLRSCSLGTLVPSGRYNIHVTPLSLSGTQHGVLLMFEQVEEAKGPGGGNGVRPGRENAPQSKNKPAPARRAQPTSSPAASRKRRKQSAPPRKSRRR